MVTSQIKLRIIIALGMVLFSMVGAQLMNVSQIQPVVTQTNRSNDENITPLAMRDAPIYLVGNVALATFCAGNVTEDGSQSNPYVIQNYVINATTANGIDIEDTTANLVIQNCVVENGSAFPYYFGIYLSNTSNVNIIYNTLSNNYDGMELYQARQHHD